MSVTKTLNNSTGFPDLVTWSKPKYSHIIILISTQKLGGYGRVNKREKKKEGRECFRLLNSSRLVISESLGKLCMDFMGSSCLCNHDYRFLVRWLWYWTTCQLFYNNQSLGRCHLENKSFYTQFGSNIKLISRKQADCFPVCIWAECFISVGLTDKVKTLFTVILFI